MSNAADRLIRHAMAVRWETVPAIAQEAAVTFLHDSLAVGIAGKNERFADTVFQQACLWSGQDGTSLVLGRSGQRLKAPYAAFVNAYQIHCQEFDCVHEPAVAHPMATVGAAILAEAGRSGPIAGKRFLESAIVGVDVIAALGVAVRGSLKFFRPATAGIFGSVAALAKLRGLGFEETRIAFGHALSFASGTMQAHVEGKPTLALQVAAASRSAVEAVDLAIAGFPAPEFSLDGPFGYFSLFESEVHLDTVLDELSGRSRIAEVSWKPFPTGRAAHGAIVSMQTLMSEQGVTADNLSRFTYRAPPLIERLVGRRPKAGMSVNYARLCFAWLGANVLLNGTVSLEDFSDENLNDPRRLQLAEKIRVESDGTSDWAAFTPAVGVAVLTDGKELHQDVARQFGAPEWPLTPEQHRLKAAQCLQFGGLPDRASDLAELMTRFDEVRDVHAALAEVME